VEVTEKMEVTAKLFPMHQLLLVRRDPRALLVLQVPPVQQVPQDLQVQAVVVQALQVQQVHKVRKVFKACKVKQEQLVHEVILEQQVSEDHQG
jgi:hypothetical protein